MNSGHCFVSLALASVGLAATGGSLAQSNPFYVGVAQGFTHESNVFRVADGAPRSGDSYSTTSLLGGIDQPFGRQRFFTDAAVRHSRYRENDQLNNTGYSLATGLDWETIGDLSGRVSYAINENLARYGADDGPTLFTKNMERSQELNARGRYEVISPVAIEAILAHRQLDYSAVQADFQEFKQDSISLGALYRAGGALTLGTAVRRTSGRYPFAVESSPGVFQQDDFHRNDLDLTAVWSVTGQSTLRGRLSYTKESHDALTSRDISGATGALSWDYKPTAKLSFNTEVMRDSGAESRFGRAGSVTTATNTNTITTTTTSFSGNNSQLSNSLSVRARYEATAKIQTDAFARHVRRDLVNTFALGSGGASTNAGSDTLLEAKIGVNYVPIRSVVLGCAFGYEKRSASSTLSYDYTANVTSCSAQLKLQ